jgi:predicted CXXCH cytochrome family protein
MALGGVLILDAGTVGVAPLRAERDSLFGEPSYVGRSTCARCHEAEHAAWQGSHHDLAMQEATEGTVLGDFADAAVVHGGISSVFYKKDGRFFVRTEGPDGRPRDYRIAYAFGAYPLQQYLIGFPDGRYQALGLAWDARPVSLGGQRWFHLYRDDVIAAGDPLHWTGRLQNWNSQCAECHSTNLRKNYDPESDRFRTTWSEIDVSCEACHGPGSAHVTWAQSWDRPTGSDTGAKGLVVRFSDRGSEGGWRLGKGASAHWFGPPRSRAEIETCAICHSRRRAISESHRPGQGLLNSHVPALLEEGLYYLDGQIDDEVYVYGSFLQSRMHRAGVVCSDCHEPHSLALKAEGNALCGQCHQSEAFDVAAHHHHQPGSDGSQCVNCHMPAKNYMVVDPRRDHSIRVPRPDLSIVLTTPNACSQCHKGRSDRWAMGAISAWLGPDRGAPSHFGAALLAGRKGTADAGRLLAALVTDRAQPAIARATALSLLPRYVDQTSIEAYRVGLGDEDPLVRMAALGALRPFAPDQRFAAAGQLLQDPVKAVRIEAARMLGAAPQHRMSSDQRAALETAITEFVASQMAAAERPETHFNLGVFHADRGRLSAAESAHREALRRDGSFVPAYVNLADLLSVRGRDDEAESVLRRAIETVPAAAAPHHALGLLLVRQRRVKEASDSLARAATLAPENARYSYVYGIALNSTGRADAAIEVLEEARTRHPDDRELLVALATINRDMGALDRAREYARRLASAYPNDPTARRLLIELQRRQ